VEDLEVPLRRRSAPGLRQQWWSEEIERERETGTEIAVHVVQVTGALAFGTSFNTGYAVKHYMSGN